MPCSRNLPVAETHASQLLFLQLTQRLQRGERVEGASVHGAQQRPARGAQVVEHERDALRRQWEKVGKQGAAARCYRYVVVAAAEEGEQALVRLLPQHPQTRKNN